jgi:two-component system, chemotaxis family, CheB/CheR fusion protein
MKPSPSPKQRNRSGEDRQDDGYGRPSVTGEEFVIVAIGASAGGLEAFTELVRALPANTGMAFVLVQHLDPTHHSMLTELLAKSTAMSVSEVKNGMKVQANHVYVIPPNCMMTIADRVLQLNPREDVYATRMTVDHFMRSLAEDQGPRCVGVILSGSGTDGTLGLGEIQAQGGVTFAQDETTARHDGMPRSAIAAGTVDFVLPPKEIARELVRIAANRFVLPLDREEAEQEQEQAREPHPAIHTIFQLLRKSSGVDFTYYRHTTIRRRIQRRMVVHKIESLDDYVKYLQQNPAEVKALYQDMLINVTSFFRNPAVFDSLKSVAYPAILKNRPRDTTIRVWAPGCASGEETYSLAITLLEFLGDKASEIPIQLFGTDVNEASIIKARTGIYPENIQGDVSAERLRRYFSKTETGYRVTKTIRDMCIFAQHNVLYDPPFSQLDLICCRNVLIYLEPVLQKKIVSLFHYALRPAGFLTLGISEGVGSSTNLFSLVDRSSKIFAKKAIASHVPVNFSVDRKLGELSLNPRAVRGTGEPSWSYPDFQKECDRRLLAQYAPATVFVNQDLEVIHSRGELDPYLKLPSGRASLSILRMVREGLLSELRNAVAQATRQTATVRRKNVVIKNGKTSQTIELEVVPLHMGNLKERYFMIVFHDSDSREREKESRAGGRRGKTKEAAQSEARDRRIARLEQELAATKEYLQSVIESQEATNEELQSANEEILSSNEELQSTNEELETAKEELQSTNEELTTVNDELRNRNTEITQTNSDLNTLLAVSGIGMLMLNNDLTIRRFTSSAQKIFGLIPADVGRPFRNIKPTIDMPDIGPMIEKVAGDLSIAEKDVQDRAGSWFKLRVSPYRSVDDRVDGVVITAMATKGSEDGGGRQTGASAGLD